ncbi:MAG: HAMP domain-containing sensor histidine kinase [Desulfobacterales bacterium]|nr:HAMP domain-containing sensor histidine kinase [Desulfobacterales bacterium]
MTADAKNHHKISDYMEKTAPILFFLLSSEGRILDANQFAKTIAPTSLRTARFDDLVLDFSGKFRLKSLTDDGGKEHLLSINTASGMPQSFYFSFVPAENHVLVFGRLDTDQIESMRKEVLSLNQELNNLTRQLHQKNAQLERLNREKNQFLGMAAHDLRKPIGLVMSYSEFLIDEAETLDPEQMQFLRTINASSTFMKRLVDDFLDVSAIEAGKFDLDPARASLFQVLQQSLELNHLQAMKKGIDLEVRCHENIPLILMDASKIEQVITNLVSNAIEHTPPATRVTITLSTDPQWISFSVQDEGKGIPADEMEKIFKPFEKTSIKKSGGEKSTGLGMLISRKIIEAHKGQIWVESPPGRGAAFHFTLPKADVVA